MVEWDHKQYSRPLPVVQQKERGSGRKDGVRFKQEDKLEL